MHLSPCLGWDAVLPKSLYIQGQSQQHKGPWTGLWHKSPANKLRSLLPVEARKGSRTAGNGTRWWEYIPNIQSVIHQFREEKLSQLCMTSTILIKFVEICVKKA